MKKLSNITVLGRKIKIKYTDPAVAEDWGSCDPDNGVIFISEKCLEDKNIHWWTLVHEVTHLIFHMSGLSSMERNEEESYVRCVENLVIPWVLGHQYILDGK